jgi:hypothetical protein
MREIEFLPAWYPNLRRRKRIARLQSAVVVLLLCGFCAWAGLAHHNVMGAETSLQILQEQLDQTHIEQTILSQQLDLRQQLQDREQLIGSLGYPVQMTRLMQKVDQVMPKEMSLLQVDCNVEETPRVVTSVAGVKPGDNKEPQLDRRLKVRLLAIAPSEVDLANFLAGLTSVPFFDQVAPSYARSRNDSGHIVREFEVTFVVNLNRESGT